MNNSMDDLISKIPIGAVHIATEKQMKNWDSLFSLLQSTGKFAKGAIKVITPDSYQPTVKTEKEINSIKIETPYEMMISNISDGYYKFQREEHVRKKGKRPTASSKKSALTAGDLRKMGHCPPLGIAKDNFDEIERAYWNEIRKKGCNSDPVKLCTYGSDNDGTLMDFGTGKITMCQVPSALLEIVHRYEQPAAGITTSQLFIGVWTSTFVQHIEDKDLWALSYNHTGEAKIWYTVAPEYAEKLELAVSDDLKKLMKSILRHQCAHPLRHKQILADLSVFKKHDIPLVKHIQRPGDYVILPPRCYHFGFNCGWNVAEALNFGPQDWMYYGLLEKTCKLLARTINMDWFVYEFMFERYQDYMSGKLELWHPLKGPASMTLVKPEHDPSIHYKAADHHHLMASGVSKVLAVKTYENMQYVYVEIQNSKFWMRRVEAEKLCWSDTKICVAVPDSHFTAQTRPPILTYASYLAGLSKAVGTQTPHKVDISSQTEPVQAEPEPATMSLNNLTTEEAIIESADHLLENDKSLNCEKSGPNKDGGFSVYREKVNLKSTQNGNYGQFREKQRVPQNVTPGNQSFVLKSPTLRLVQFDLPTTPNKANVAHELPINSMDQEQDRTVTCNSPAIMNNYDDNDNSEGLPEKRVNKTAKLTTKRRRRKRTELPNSCGTCGKDFAAFKFLTNRIRHERDCREKRARKGKFRCGNCSSRFGLLRNLTSHQQSCTQVKTQNFTPDHE